MAISRFEGVLVKSSNIGAYKFARQLGAKRFFEYAHRFGFGRKTGILLSGESSGIAKNTGNAVDFSRAAYGYALNVTPLQMACAYSAIAGDGKLLKPKIVKSLVANDGTVVENLSDGSGRAGHQTGDRAEDARGAAKSHRNRRHGHACRGSGLQGCGQNRHRRNATTRTAAAILLTAIRFPLSACCRRRTRPSSAWWSSMIRAPTRSRVTAAPSPRPRSRASPPAPPPT